VEDPVSSFEGTAESSFSLIIKGHITGEDILEYPGIKWSYLTFPPSQKEISDIFDFIFFMSRFINLSIFRATVKFPV